MRFKKSALLIGLYLIAIVLANLAVTRFGPNSTIIVAFLFIGFNITSRDYLHRMWTTGLVWKMALLIGTGSFISWLVNNASGQIALASFIAFGVSELVDTLVFQRFHQKSFIWQVNGSNLVSSFIDSALFLTLAFGSFMPLLILAQYGAKVSGGTMWVYILKRFRDDKSILRTDKS